MSRNAARRCPIDQSAPPRPWRRAPEGVPVYPHDIYSAEAIRDPYPHYQALRALGPVVWLAKQGVYALPRYDEVRQVLGDDGTYHSGNGVPLNAVARRLGSGSTLLSDGEVHRARRQLLAHRLTPRALRPMQAQIDALADETVRGAVEREHVDGVDDLALALPLTVVPDLVGWPHRGRDKLVRWAGATFDSLGPFNRQMIRTSSASIGMLRFVHLLARRRDVLPGSMAAEIFQAVDAGTVPASACPGVFIDYMAPSIDTTAGAIAAALWLFATHPEQWALLKDDPSLVPGAVHEIVRIESPLRAFGRVASRQTEIAGTTIPDGARLLVLYASANRDELAWDEPDRFDITRDATTHVGFGYGSHGCAGQGLARAETQAVLRALLAHVDRIELDGAPHWAMNNVIHRLDRLPIRLVPLNRSAEA